jgi:hypothetical protein
MAIKTPGMHAVGGVPSLYLQVTEGTGRSWVYRYKLSARRQDMGLGPADFGDLPVPVVDVGLVKRVLEPIWAAKPETASRVRGRVESILDYATARGGGRRKTRRAGADIGKICCRIRRRCRRVEHHAVLPYAEIGAFMADLRQ